MHPLRLMTYNVRYFGHPTRGLLSTRGGIDRIAEGIAGLDPLPDLVCLQEVETRSLRSSATMRGAPHGASQLDRLLEALDQRLSAGGRDDRFDAYYFPAHRYGLTEATAIYTTGLAVLARQSFRVLGTNATRPHDITHRPRQVRLKQTRICAHVAFEHRSGERVEVFNTHLSLPAFWSKEFWTGKYRMGFGPNQLEEARALVRFIDRERQTDHFVVAGDFNSLPGSPVDRYLREEVGLVDAFQAIGSRDDHGARGFPTAGFMNLRMHIDHLYGSRSMEWLDLDDTHAFGEAGRFDGLSDHVPIIARCRIPPVGVADGAPA